MVTLLEDGRHTKKPREELWKAREARKTGAPKSARAKLLNLTRLAIQPIQPIVPTLSAMIGEVRRRRLQRVPQAAILGTTPCGALRRERSDAGRRSH
jgi:hypothetical protein